MTRKATSSAAAVASMTMVCAEAQPTLWRLRDGVDEHHQRRGDGRCSEGVVAAPLCAHLAFGHDLGAKARAAAPMGTLRKKMYLPPHVAGQQSSGEQPDRGARRAHGPPDAEGLVALGSLGKDVHHDGESGRQHDCRTEVPGSRA